MLFMSLNSERPSEEQQPQDQGRRDLLVDAADLGTKVIAADIAFEILSKTQPLRTTSELMNLRERGKRLDAITPKSVDTSPLTNNPQEETLSETDTQFTNTPDLKQNEDISAQDILKWIKDHLPIIGPAIGAIGAGATTIGVVLNHRGRERDAQRQQERNEDLRFQDILSGLGSDEIIAKTTATTRLLTFLHEPGLERFHQQILDLTVTYLRTRDVDENKPQPNLFYQEIIKVFMESIPLVREKLSLDSLPESKRNETRQRFLNATGVHLDGADLSQAQFQDMVMKDATFVQATLYRANLHRAFLSHADFYQAGLFHADLTDAFLGGAILTSGLIEADLTNAFLGGADLSNANFSKANLTNAFLGFGNYFYDDLPTLNLDESSASINTNLTNANLSNAILARANLYSANLTGANPEKADSLTGANMYDVKGYDDPIKRQMCKDKGASFDPPETQNTES